MTEEEVTLMVEGSSLVIGYLKHTHIAISMF